MFIAARGLIGFGLGFACNAAPLLITELAYPTQRGPYTSLYNSTWYLGSIIAAWTTFGTFQIQSTWSWRIPSILQGLPSILQFFLILAVPESPRWLVAHGKHEEARRVLAKYHANKDPNDPLVVFEMSEIQNALVMEREATQGASMKTLFATKGNRRRLLIIFAIAFFSQWSGNGLVSYYLVPVLNSIGITDSFDQQLINGILQIWNYITAIAGALAVDRAGRRTLFLTSNIGMFISFVIWTACSAVYQVAVEEGRTPSAQAGHAVIAMIFIFYTAYNLAYSPLLVAYTVEILPFQIRAKGLAFMNFCVSAALVFNQYVNPLALEAISWKYYLVFAIWLGVELVFAWFFIIETKGHSLEEIAALFDGPGKVGEVAERAELGSVQAGSDVTLMKQGSSVIFKPACRTHFSCTIASLLPRPSRSYAPLYRPPTTSKAKFLTRPPTPKTINTGADTESEPATRKDLANTERKLKNLSRKFEGSFQELSAPIRGLQMQMERMGGGGLVDVCANWLWDVFKAAHIPHQPIARKVHFTDPTGWESGKDMEVDIYCSSPLSLVEFTVYLDEDELAKLETFSRVVELVEKIEGRKADYKYFVALGMDREIEEAAKRVAAASGVSLVLGEEGLKEVVRKMRKP
ncbi:hypothetical protein HDV00_011537 [Rhizophlyctis rosea]|nr:hypothetical protein HDV00_011537 [Rhizophlyctis rosea]